MAKKSTKKNRELTYEFTEEEKRELDEAYTAYRAGKMKLTPAEEAEKRILNSLNNYELTEEDKRELDEAYEAHRRGISKSYSMIEVRKEIMKRLGN